LVSDRERGARKPGGPALRRVPITNGDKPRTAGLHAGLGWMRDDFDAALPDSFWGDAPLHSIGC
jgi:hypothetical protein